MIFTRIALATIAAGLCMPATGQAAPPAPTDNQELVQISTINALIKGLYDGDMTIGQLRKLGSFGIGTVDQLDGEMLALDGKVYHITSDGKVHIVPDSSSTPFAAVTFFQADSTTPAVSAKSMEELQQTIDKTLPSKNLFYAVKVTGSFPDMKVRSVPRQHQPYRPLTEVVKDQSIFDYKNTSGTLVGFRCPAYVQGINVAGYHLHYLSNDKTQGGHVLGFELQDGTVQIDSLADFRMILPEDEEFMHLDLTEQGDEAIHKVEKLRAE